LNRPTGELRLLAAVEPPPPEDVDPARLPREHRSLFLKAIEEAVAADRVVDAPERESLRLLYELLQ
jgi:hypothetical protein